MLQRAAVALTALLTLAVPLAVPVAAAEVASDAETAVRDIVFPVDGEYRYSDTFGASRGGGRGHQGTDIMTDKLTPLVAARDAEVTWLKDTATPDGSQGNYLMLRDDDGWEYWYIHVNNDSPGTDDGANPTEWTFGPGIERGARVEAGQLVAYAGDSGNAEHSAPHLHFEIHKPDGTVVNPYRSLQRAEGRTGEREPSPQYATSAEDERYVRALAVDFLDRPATEDEIERDASRLASGTSKAEVVAGYAESDEWVSALVTRFYESTLGRQPDDEGLQHWIEEIAGGMTPAEVAANFYGSDEYVDVAGGTHEAWVTDLYRELLLREPDDGRDHWVGKADAGVHRGTIAGSFYASLESRHMRVANLYLALLDREPDHGGLAHWSSRLRDGRDIALAVVLAVSPEYHARASTRDDL